MLGLVLGLGAYRAAHKTSCALLRYTGLHILEVHRMGAGAGGAGGWAYRGAEAAQRRLQYPAAAAMAVGSKQCGRSQSSVRACLRRSPSESSFLFLIR